MSDLVKFVKAALFGKKKNKNKTKKAEVDEVVVLSPPRRSITPAKKRQAFEFEDFREQLEHQRATSAYHTNQRSTRKYRRPNKSVALGENLDAPASDSEEEFEVEALPRNHKHSLKRVTFDDYEKPWPDRASRRSRRRSVVDDDSLKDQLDYLLNERESSRRRIRKLEKELRWRNKKDQMEQSFYANASLTLPHGQPNKFAPTAVYLMQAPYGIPGIQPNMAAALPPNFTQPVALPAMMEPRAFKSSENIPRYQPSPVEGCSGMWPQAQIVNTAGKQQFADGYGNFSQGENDGTSSDCRSDQERLNQVKQAHRRQCCDDGYGTVSSAGQFNSS